MNKRGQLTIFVILGIFILTTAIILILISFDKGDGTEIHKNLNNKKTDVEMFIEGCINPAIEQSLEKVLTNGGHTEKKDLSLIYKFEEINYLCYTSEDSTNCVNLEPMLINLVREEIKKDSLSGVEICFDKLENIYSGFEISKGQLDYEINILPGKIGVNLKKEIEINLDDGNLLYEDFSFEFNSPLYTFLTMTTEIVNEESTCNCFEESCAESMIGTNRFNPAFMTTRFVLANGEKVYTIKYLRTGEEFNFAVRNCIRENE